MEILFSGVYIYKGTTDHKNLHGNKRERVSIIHYFLSVLYQENIDTLYFSTE